jgi:serine/threonine-protein kinase PknK
MRVESSDAGSESDSGRLHVALRRRPRGYRGHDVFPGFTDVQEIGVGSLAVVFRAREIGTHRQVALKLLNVRDASPRSIESFERESIALGALSSHPNIVTLYRTFRTPDGRPVLVLELCSGAVADRLHGGAGLPVTDVVSIGIKIAGALETAHRGGILHRDVKPQNILVTEFGEPALADFGVAMLQSSTQTTAGLFDFTTLHAAPELLEGTGTSAATDVYELASSLYQLIAGQSAFRAYEGESPASVILRILRDPVRPLSAIDVPVTLSDLLIRAMSKEKDERPPTAAEFAAELAEVEILRGWNRTQFLIRDPGPLGTGLAPTITRMPDAVPRGIPSTLAPSGPINLTPVTSPHDPVPLAPRPRPVPQPAAAGWSAPTINGAGDWTAPPPSANGSVTTPPTAPPWVPPPPAHVIAPPVVPPPVLAPPAAEPAAEPAPDGWWSAPPADAPAEAPEPAQPAESWAPPPAEPQPAASEPVEPVEAESAVPAPDEEPVAPAPSAPPARATAPQQLAPTDWTGFAPPSGPGTFASSGRRRVPVEIDDEYLPAAGPGGPSYSARHIVPAEEESQPPPVVTEDHPGTPAIPGDIATEPESQAAAEIAPAPPDAQPVPPPAVAAPVPVWAVRAPTAGGQPMPISPQFVGDLSLDPMSLRPRTTLRAGASAVTIDEHELRLRNWFKRSQIPWTDVQGFEAQLETLDSGPASTGQIVALTALGPVELGGTRRPLAELRYVHALLDAYRIRAQRVANR